MSALVRSRLRYVAALGISGAAYFAGAKVGLAFTFVHATASPIWPPTGIALAALLLFGVRVWPALTVAAFLATYGAHTPALVAAGVAVGGTLAPLAAFHLIRRVRGPVFSLERLPDVAALCGAAAAATLASALLGSLSFVVTGMVGWSGFARSLGVWWVGDALGMIVAAPAILAWVPTFRSRVGRWSWGEFAAFAVTLLCACVVAFSARFAAAAAYPLAYLILPLAIWAALRLGIRGIVTTTMMVAAVAVWATTHGRGPFAGSMLLRELLLLDTFLAVVAISGMFLAAVTAQHAQAMAALRESEERFRTLFEQARVGIVLGDPATRIVQANPFFCELLGRAASELVGRRFVDVTHPDDQRLAAMQAARLFAGEVDLPPVEKRYLRPDGHVVRARVTHSIVRDPAGVPRHVIGIVEDISARARAEAMMHVQGHLLDTVKQAVIATDLHGRIHYWNRFAEQLYGWTAGEVLGRDIAAVTPSPTKEKQAADVRARLTRGESWTGEFEVARRSGATFVAQVSDSPIVDASGAIIGVVGVSTDVTERRALEAQLRQSQKLQAIGQLAGGVAHDFNNLLTVIRAHAQFALELLPPESPVREELEIAERAADRAAELTQQLLAFSRKQVLQPRVLDLNATVRGVTPMLRRLIGENIDVVTRLSPQLSTVLADPGQFEQVIVNLIVNARDAMPDGGRLTIETTDAMLGEADVGRHAPECAPGPYVRLVVRDTGVGMDAATQAHVFEPFFTTKEAGRGTGLGLATVYGIVNQSGGFLRLESQPGRGTRFEIYLPAHEPAGVEAEECVTGPRVRPGTRGSERVLLVEDDDSVRRLVRRMLVRQGYTVVEARHGAHALEIAAAGQQRFDIVVTDMVMPQLSGRSLVDRLAAGHPELKVLFMSGYTDDAVVRRELPQPDTAFLQKPFTVDELLRSVRAVLDGPEGGRVMRRSA